MTPEFRVWDKNTERMWDIETWHFEDEYLDLIEPGVSICDPCIERIWRKQGDVELMQYTGLKDANGNKIFEGDIVSISNHPFQKHKGDLTGIDIEGNYEINWSERDLTWLAGMWKCSETRHYLTVIGNSHENSELLEEKA
jgi:uncharacterized phage protein (TIGR01671 family)